MVSDPPYRRGLRSGLAQQGRRVERPARTGKVLNDDRADWREAWALFPGDVAYVWHGGCTRAPSPRAWRPAALPSAPDHLGEGAACAQPRRLPLAARALLVRRREGGKAHWPGDRKQTTLWQIAPRDDDAATVHGTQKPVECMRRPILNNSARGQAVYEPFAGTGTTIIAAEKSGRRCLGIELEPRYCDVIVERWQKVPGKAAMLDGDGRTFDEVAGERLPKAA